MKEYILDTNAVLRFLLNDIPEQAEQTKKYLHQAKAGLIGLSIPLVVFIEAVYILTKQYGVSKTIVVDKLNSILDFDFVEVETRDIIRDGILSWQQNNVSFIDMLIFIEAKKRGKSIITFDKKLQKLAKSLPK